MIETYKIIHGLYDTAVSPSLMMSQFSHTGRNPGHAVGMADCGHSKIARVRAYYLYCMCLAVLTMCVDFDCDEVLSDP